jgi:putative membrane protein
MIGLALGLLLVFRTNTAYDRFWEGRKQLGGLGISSRNLAIKANTIIPVEEHALRSEVVALIGAYGVALKDHLRDGVDLEKLEDLSPSIKTDLKGYTNPLNGILSLLSVRFYSGVDKKWLPPPVFSVFSKSLDELQETLRALERIRTTPLPFAYVNQLKVFMLVYFLTLPVVLIPAFGYATIVAMIVIIYALVGIEEIGIEIEDPFGDDPNDLPVDKICQGIRKDAREILGVYADEDEGEDEEVAAKEVDADATVDAGGAVTDTDTSDQALEALKTQTGDVAEDLFRKGLLLSKTSGDAMETYRAFHESAVLGHVRAKYNLGILNFKGQGVPKNIDEAYYWFRDAAAHGSADARKTLKSVKALRDSEADFKENQKPLNPVLMDTLNEEQRFWYAKAITQMVMVDGRIDVYERTYLHESIKMLENSVHIQELEEAILLGRDFEIEPNTSFGPEDQKRILQELIEIATVDQDFAPQEQTLMQLIGNALGVPEADIRNAIKQGLTRVRQFQKS